MSRVAELIQLPVYGLDDRGIWVRFFTGKGDIFIRTVTKPVTGHASILSHGNKSFFPANIEAAGLFS
jgi:hypothetical protein